tara:strand:- start:5493 stop:5792 length:300 start_codon:yes stop_codon:yes gene_type:complete
MKKNKINGHVKAWSWIGKVAPLTALLALMLILVFDFNNTAEWIIFFIALSFGVVAFTWWWWVVYAVRELNRLLTTTQERFEQVMKDIKDLKDDFRNNKK